MTHRTRFRGAALVTSLALLSAVAGRSYAQNPAVADAFARLADVRKGTIEDPLKRVVRQASPAPAVAAASANPKVEPGRVRWHPTFAAACEASAKSGKPVLLFQLMGKLDAQFC